MTRSNRWVSPIATLAGLAIILALSLQLDRVRTPLGVGGAVVEGRFNRNAMVPSGDPGPRGLRKWNSWLGSDQHRGRLALGPMTAGSEIRFYAAGYPQVGYNRLVFFNQATGETWNPRIANIGERWMEIVIRLPSTWRGAPVTLSAVDDATGTFGWLAVSEPYAVPWWARWWGNFARKLVAFLACGTVLFFMATTAGVVLVRRSAVRGPELLFLSMAGSTAVGLGLFWLFFADAKLGSAAAWAVLAAAVVPYLWRGAREAAATLWRQNDWWQPALLMAAAGISFVAALLLYWASGGLEYLASHRFAVVLPGDNSIPGAFAERLITGQSPRALYGDWLSSDRPPLQTGWILMSIQPLLLLGIDFENAAQCAGIWFQLLWVPAVWAWLRTIGVRGALAALIVAALVPTGFLFLHSVFVWPKLGAGALMLGAYTIWFAPLRQGGRVLLRFVAGGVCAALAWLAHGAVAFAALGLVPFALASIRRVGIRPWLAAGTAFAVLALPWTAYQKFYEPPANRLLKMHLAGVFDRDDRGTFETMVQEYGKQSFGQWVDGRRWNVKFLFVGKWREHLTYAPTDRQNPEFYHSFFALGWWNVGSAALLAGWLPLVRRRYSADEIAHLLRGIGWVFATFAVWIVLMFRPGGTIVHQGAFTTLLILLPAFALGLWRLHPLAFAAVAVAQILAFCQVWLRPPPNLAGAAPRDEVVVVLGFAAAALVAVVALAWKSPADARSR